MTAATATGTCPECGQPQDLAPGGQVATHYDDRWPASARRCAGSRQEPAAPRRVVECDECHRPLTDRLARMWSLGRDCRRKRGLRDIRAPGRFEVEQEGLFSP